MSEIEILQQDIIDPSLTVGSGCEWQGQGTAPQWHNPKSTKAYDHIERHHGPQLKPENIKGRAASTHKSQGQWFNMKDVVRAEQSAPKHPGQYILNFQQPIGRVYHPNGSITEDVTDAAIGRKTDGTLRYGYPVIKNYTL
ncbi:MAG: hypothetical protein WBB29_14600 [Geitlerinemataceae cyanobacterium]